MMFARLLIHQSRTNYEKGQKQADNKAQSAKGTKIIAFGCTCERIKRGQNFAL